MTADHSGKEAAGILASLKKLREHWLLIAALASALFWARDLALVYARLPDAMTRQEAVVTGLEGRVAGLERTVRTGTEAGPGTGSGDLSGLATGRAGAWTTLLWQSVPALDPSCRARSVSAVLVDAGGRWHALETRLEPRRDPGAGVDGAGGLAFGVQPHVRMGVGYARIRLRVAYRCRGELTVESSPWLTFVLRGA